MSEGHRKFPEVRAELTPSGLKSKVLIDGEDISSDLTAITIHASVEGLTWVRLQSNAEVDVRAEGQVYHICSICGRGHLDEEEPEDENA